MESREIRTSPWKSASWLVISLAFVIVSILGLIFPTQESGLLWGPLAVFAAAAVVSCWLLARPLRLRLDAEGFTVSGGFQPQSRTVSWVDVGPFFIVGVGQGVRMVGYDLRPGARRAGGLSRLNRALGADEALPQGWTLSPDQLAEVLNTWRTRALAARGAAGAQAVR
jgi:hypothetical protein